MSWGTSSADYSNGGIDGRSDLLDFFPVWLDLHQTLNILPPSGSVQCKLKQANGSVKAVYTDLTKSQAGAYLTTAGNTYGASFNQNSYEAATFDITSSGATLATDFLDKIKNHAAKGILLVEGKGTTSAPLVLEIWKDGTIICEKEMPLSLDCVEEMYRWINLRHVTGGTEARATDTDEPSNYPDRLCNGKQFVFVHGYNNDEQAARAASAEVFKRLYQSGARSMFTGVAWHGDATPGILPAGAYYYADVINAFQTAPDLASSIAALSGEKYLAAHSLGNMVASSAIVDHGLNPVRYYMIDAAVATEAYKATERQPGDIAISPWPSYTNRVWASEWYRLFDATDGRHGLTWRGRFGNIRQAVNYYSSGEDVLNNNEAGGPISLFDVPNRVWILQEQVKGGILPVILVGVDSHGGWGFNPCYDIQVGEDEYGSPIYDIMPPQQAALLSNGQLQTKSFFTRFYSEEIYGRDGSQVAASAEVRGKVLAEAIPATSEATGRNEVDGFFSANVDMMTLKTGWPRLDGKWYHSDFKNVAFPYVHQLFEDMVAEGGLQ